MYLIVAGVDVLIVKVVLLNLELMLVMTLICVNILTILPPAPKSIRFHPIPKKRTIRRSSILWRWRQRTHFIIQLTGFLLVLNYLSLMLVNGVRL